MDRYTKIVLTFIAFALWANLFVSLSPSGGGLIRDAHAQGITRVMIVGAEATIPVVLPTQGQFPQPVYLTTDPRNPSSPMVVPVNLAQIGSKTFQQGVVLPVDVEGIAGSAVKSSGGLPVTVAQPVAVTAKDPLPIAAKTPLQVAVTGPVQVAATTPMQVIVTKLPLAPTQFSPASASSTSGSGSSTTGGGPGN